MVGWKQSSHWQSALRVCAGCGAGLMVGESSPLLLLPLLWKPPAKSSVFPPTPQAECLLALTRCVIFQLFLLLRLMTLAALAGAGGSPVLRGDFGDSAFTTAAAAY